MSHYTTIYKNSERMCDFLALFVLNCEDDYIEVSKLIKHFATLT